jgi:hypothetical protein
MHEKTNLGGNRKEISHYAGKTAVIFEAKSKFHNSQTPLYT